MPCCASFYVNFYDSSLCAAPYSSPQNLSAASLTSTSITLQWLPPPDHLLNGIIRYYHILISDPTEVTVHDSLVDGGELEVFVDDLHPYFLYNCSIAAVTVEDGPPSSIQILTLEDGEFIGCCWFQGVKSSLEILKKSANPTTVNCKSLDTTKFEIATLRMRGQGTDQSYAG